MLEFSYQIDCPSCRKSVKPHDQGFQVFHCPECGEDLPVSVVMDGKYAGRTGAGIVVFDESGEMPAYEVKNWRGLVVEEGVFYPFASESYAELATKAFGCYGSLSVNGVEIYDSLKFASFPLEAHLELKKNEDKDRQAVRSALSSRFSMFSTGNVKKKSRGLNSTAESARAKFLENLDELGWQWLVSLGGDVADEALMGMSLDCSCL